MKVKYEALQKLAKETIKNNYKWGELKYENNNKR
jgi:hypothetical protein